MKKVLLAAAAVALIAVACLKADKVEPCVSKTVEAELPAMKKFAEDSAITYQQHESGILYQIVQPGDGPNPTSNSTVAAKYRGYFLNGQMFDQSTTPAEFNLSQVIRGWTIILPLLKKGGAMKMIIPSSLAYDCHPYYVAFQNKPLYFYVELSDVK